MAQGDRKVVLVVHNVRSALNVGSLLRTAEGLGVEKVYLTGYTPYPESKGDARLPHLRQRAARQIHKTALGAEYFIAWQQQDNTLDCLNTLAKNGYQVAALEQTPSSIRLDEFKTKKPVALVVGNEISGVDKAILHKIKDHLQIPMSGHKESFNVAVAAGIALYHLCYLN